MQKLIFVNGNGVKIDLTSNDFGITNWGGLSNANLNVQTQEVPFEDGSVYLDSLIDEREINVTVAINDSNDLEKRYELKRQLISALNAKLGEGTLIYTNDYLSKQIKAIPQLPLFKNKNSNDRGTLKATLSFTCCNPYWEDIEETQISFGEDLPVVENTGDIPANVEMMITGTNFKNPVVRNLTNGQKIKINGTFTDNIYFNSNMGKKELITEDLNFQWVNGYIYTASYSDTEKTLLFSDGKILKIDNELNMKIIETNYSGTVKSVLFVNNIFYILINSKIYKSTDLETWVQIYEGLYVRSFIYIEDSELFIYSDSTNIYSSSDCINWTSIYYNQIGVDYLFYAKEIHRLLTTSDHSIIYTDDLTNFTTVSISDNNVYIFYANGKYILGGINLGKIKVSEDLTSWDTINTEKNTTYNTFIYHEGYYYLSSGIGEIFVSPNMQDYELIPVGGTLIDDFIYSNQFRKLLIPNYKGMFCYGLKNSWNTYGTSGLINSVIYSESLKCYFTCSYSGYVARSFDGITWEEIAYFGDYRILTQIIETEDKIIICGYERLGQTSQGHIYYCNKENVFDWNDVTVTGSIYLKYICYSEEKKLFVSCGTSYGSLFISNDLETWTQINTTTSGISYNAVIYSEYYHCFLLVGSNTSLTYKYIFKKSEDGITWEDITLQNETMIFSNIIANDNKITIIGSKTVDGNNKALVLTSENLVVWNYYVNENYSSFSKVKYIKEYNLYYLLTSTDFLITNNFIDYKNYNITNLSDIAIDIQNASIILVGSIAYINKATYDNKVNIISSLSADSDINFKLEVGSNQLRIDTEEGSVNVVLTYKNKYIGV